MTEEERHWLEEYLKTIRNLCDTALIILEHGHDNLIHTTLEFLYQEAQNILEEHCIVDK